MDADRRLAKRAEKHLGNITRADVLSFGLTEEQLHYRLEQRGWTEVLPGVYRLPGVPDSFESRLVATKLWLRGRGHFTGSTAAYIMRLHGVDEPARIEVAMHTEGKAPSGLSVHRLQPQDHPALRSVFGFRVPETERVLLDCAAALPPKAVGLAMDDALRRKMTSVVRLRSFASKHCGRGVRGSKLFRTLIGGRDANDEKARTAFETAMLRILRRIEGLKILPDYHVRVGDDDFYIDFYLPDPVLGLECQSRKWHGTERSKRDVVRDRKIRSLGIQLLYFTYDDVMLDPSGTEAELRAAIARRLRSISSAHPARSTGCVEEKGSI